jgi:hypothetical protein
MTYAHQTLGVEVWRLLIPLVIAVPKQKVTDIFHLDADLSNDGLFQL